jgi:cobalt-zinc-cadmium resistance protein CzcA
MVLKLIGTNTSTVIRDVKTRMGEINKVLPPGIRVAPYYDQATLVAKCVRTVTKALVEAAFLIVLIQLAMLGGIRPSVVVLAAIPFSLAFSFLLMRYFGVSANLMSLGGLAIALGLLVDGSVVMAENVDRMLSTGDADETVARVVLRACLEVARPIVLSLLIIVIVFLPLFTLQGVEGKTFRPMAQTMAFAMFGSMIFAVLLAPVLGSLLMRRPKQVASGAQGIHRRPMAGERLPAHRNLLRPEAAGGHRNGVGAPHRRRHSVHPPRVRVRPPAERGRPARPGDHGPLNLA